MMRRIQTIVLGLSLAAGCDLGLDPGPPLPIQPAGLGEEEARSDPSSAAPWVGVIVARQSVDIASRVGGSVATLPVSVGDRVAPGDVVATLEDPQARLGLRAAQASAQAARSAVSRARVDRQHARRQHGQAERLGDIATDDERAQAEHAVARAGADEAGARGELALQQVEIERRRDQLGALTLEASFAGRVALHHHAPGEHIAAGTPLVRIVSDEILVRIAVPAADAFELETGTPLEFWAEGATVPVRLAVEHIAPEVDAASYVLVEARLDGDAVRNTPRVGTRGRVMTALTDQRLR